MLRNPQFKNPKFYMMILIDIASFIIALCLSYWLRFEFSFTNIDVVHPFRLLPWIIPLKFVIFYVLGLYKGMWRYTSLKDFWLLVQACFLSTGMVVMIILVVDRFEGYSRAVFIMDGFLTLFFTGGSRLAIRSFYALRANQMTTDYFSPDAPVKKILIIGAGDAGEKMLREIRDNYRLNYDVVGFVDDDPAKQGMTIHGVKVLGTVARLPKILQRESVEQILITVPSATGEQVRHIVEACQRCNVPYKILPGIGELIDGRVSVKLLRDISYEDLLGRSPVQLNVNDIRNYLNGKTILITGCGGSIGSELCRQVIKYQPDKIILLDSSEFNLFQIQMELQNEHDFHHGEAILGQVQDEAFMDNVFQKYRPDVVFHAAAYKHVPMLEKNPWQAVFNNIMGSMVVMEKAVQYKVDRFVLVSTDKAVRPANVMGASKRVAELIMQCQQGNGTRFMAVRFGNVVGSSGSVIPLFRRQIEMGGPVTVTHPEVKRFFMTIPEAAQMILQAGTMGNSNEIFILRMGTPVKIADMARDLIRLSGKEPDVDIKIVYTGLREGEKLYEELITVGEDIQPTVHRKVMVLRSNDFFDGIKDQREAGKKLHDKIEELKALAGRYDATGIKMKLREIVPEYTPQKKVQSSTFEVQR
ncbi:MAG TPA: nucleoside-diphosphate sugar epimerase/dehydratase [Smithella sp.]|nr:nucleoside-diphosphate sugar epimerase/dehydratase [Smithella sp.]